MLTENDICRIAKQVADAYSPLAVGTFGSYGTGIAHSGSDLDLFIIKKGQEKGPADEHAVRLKLFAVMHTMDIVVLTAESFEESGYDYMSFNWTIAKQARVYHWDHEADELIPCLLPANERGRSALGGNVD